MSRTGYVAVVDTSEERAPQGNQARTDPITATPYVWRDPSAIPRRQWLYGLHYIRGYATGTIAPGGTGKTFHVQTEALAMATGRNLLGVEPPDSGLRCWLWNLEDPREEVERRFAAAVVHSRIDPEEFTGRVFFDSGREKPLVIARKVRDTITIAEPLIEELVREIRARQIDVLIIDPFVSSHGLPENDNAAIDAAVKAWGRVAGRGNCSVELVHHSRKLNGEAISVDSARGGSAFVDGCRSVRVLARMSDDEAKKLGVDEPRRFYFTMPAKQNMAPPLDRREWFQIVSVDLANGDNVGAVQPWSPPNPFEDVTTTHLERVQALFRTGDYRESDQSREWGGYAVASVLDLDAGAGLKAKECSWEQIAARAKCKKLLSTWLANKAIAVEERQDKARREKKQFYTAGSPDHADD